MSPLTTDRSPGDWKSAAENKVPVVPPLVLLLVRNAPPTVVEPFMVNVALLALLVTTEGLALVAAAKEAVGRVDSLYAVTSVQPM